MAVLPDEVLEMRCAVVEPITIWRGATFQRRRTLSTGPDKNSLTPVDLTGCAVAAYIVNARGFPLLTLNCSIIDPATSGAFKVAAAPADTAILPIPPDVTALAGEAVLGSWLLTITDTAGNVVPLLTGEVTIAWNNTGTPAQ